MREQIQRALCWSEADAVLLTSDQNRRYATGFPSSAGVCLITRKAGYLFVDFRYIEAARKAAGGEYQVELVRGGYGELVNARCREDGVQLLAYEDAALTVEEFSKWRKALHLRMTPMKQLLSDLRKVKIEEEVQCCVRAQRIAEKALTEVLNDIRPGVTEKHLAALLTYRMLDYGGETMSFDPIVVSGAKSSMPHGVPDETVIKDGDFVVMDFGCRVEGYCSDMTRTVAVGHCTEEMRRVYDTVLQAQKAGIAAAKAGVAGMEVDAAARRVIDGAGYAGCFGHSFGHGIGLDIHELPMASQNYTEKLPAGAIISAEPGIYLPGKFGVRIEDMLLIQEGGCRNLTEAPKELLLCAPNGK